MATLKQILQIASDEMDRLGGAAAYISCGHDLSATDRKVLERIVQASDRVMNDVKLLILSHPEFETLKGKVPDLPVHDPVAMAFKCLVEVGQRVSPDVYFFLEDAIRACAFLRVPANLESLTK
jgi:hypothetical protein